MLPHPNQEAKMNGTYFQKATQMLGEAFIQIVPPGALAAYSAYEIARFTQISFSQAAGLITASLLICIMLHMVQD